MVENTNIDKVLITLGFDDFAALLGQYQHSVYSTVYSFVLNISDAEEISQDVFLSVYTGLPSFNQNAKLSTWIYRIAVNKCMDHRRRAARRRNIASIVPIGDTNIENIPDTAHTERSVLLAENRHILYRAIGEMSEKYSVIITLRYFEDLSVGDIAQILGMSIRTVETRLYRGKKKLREHLDNIDYKWEMG